MQRVKYGAKMEYEYLDNFKILQKAFKTHGIDKVSPETQRSRASQGLHQLAGAAKP
jgi:RP/EB family microtubule-associated protein